MPTMEHFDEINARFLNGDGITDEECAFLRTFYEQTANNLDRLGPQFHFAWLEAFQRMMQLERFIESRRERRT